MGRIVELRMAGGSHRETLHVSSKLLFSKQQALKIMLCCCGWVYFLTYFFFLFFLIINAISLIAFVYISAMVNYSFYITIRIYN